MAQLLKGTEVAAALDEKLKQKAAALKEQGVTPTLAIVRVGERGDDIAYEKGASKRCKRLGIQTRRVTLPDSVSQDMLVGKIHELNGEPSVHGILLFRPLPGRLDEAFICNTLAPEKDVDGITNTSNAGVFSGTSIGYPPCTPQACMEILDYFNFDATGRRAVVIGRSMVVGKPVAMMLLQRNATVTICHTKTANMPAACREADILIVAAGRAGMIGKNCLREGQVVIDVGINIDENGALHGDVDFAEAEPVVQAITPVPGGVGAVTTSVLVKHVVEAAEKAANRKG